METCINTTSKDGVMAISSDERKWINRIIKLKEEYPQQITIRRTPQSNDGCIVADIPAKWLSIKPPRTVTMTEQKKEQLRQRLSQRRTQAESVKFSSNSNELQQDDKLSI